MRRAVLLLFALLSLLVVAAGCGSGGGNGKATVLKPGEQISMKGLRFHPDHAQVTVGQKVTWVDDESVPHDVKADSGARFQSDTFGHKGTFSITPTRAGTIKYECTLHPGMTGKLTVVAK
ncbi:cupredoxin domain-containing protein [Conexibacter woesei]|uniref:cupredoxin domain-containing protein n=1 Tax=Conexibacter woesei TaxID=191495 RepID=UPI00040C285B|nr:plastocyanin/azurin family copper-binding protein [Conexibacter woesei]